MPHTTRKTISQHSEAGTADADVAQAVEASTQEINLTKLSPKETVGMETFS